MYDILINKTNYQIIIGRPLQYHHGPPVEYPYVGISLDYHIIILVNSQLTFIGLLNTFSFFFLLLAVVAVECALDEDDMLIPIIVGAALAVLVLIVILAYLIGRNRSHAGYQTI